MRRSPSLGVAPKAPAARPGKAVQPRRERLPDTRQSLTHKFDIQGHEGYLTVGFFPDGRPGEVFITMAKEGSTIGGLMDTIGHARLDGPCSTACRCRSSSTSSPTSRFEPAGFTKNPDIPIAKSVTDYIFRWLGMEFLPGYREANAPQSGEPEDLRPRSPGRQGQRPSLGQHADLEHVEAVGQQASPRPPPRPADLQDMSQHRAVRPLPERRTRLRQLRRPDRPLRHLLPLLQLRQQHGLLVKQG